MTRDFAAFEHFEDAMRERVSASPAFNAFSAQRLAALCVEASRQNIVAQTMWNAPTPAKNGLVQA
eukprot:SAG11_NODE_3851_length_2190_cov_5.705404_1_plen_65_part_00